MKKKLIGSIVVVLLVIGVGAMVIPSVLGVSGDTKFEKLGNFIGAYLSKSEDEPDRYSRSNANRPVASVNGHDIYQDDIDYEIAYAALYSDVDISEKEAAEEAAKRIILYDEAEHLGLTLDDKEIEEIRMNREENFQMNVEQNLADIDALGITQEEAIDLAVDLYVYGMVDANYFTYIYENLLRGDIVSDNPEINELINKMETTPLEEYEGYKDDLLKIKELYYQELLDTSDFEVFI